MPILSSELKDQTISMLVSRRVKDMINDDRRLALKELFEGGASIKGYNNYKEDEIIAEVRAFYKDGIKQGNLTEEEKSVFEEVIKVVDTNQSSECFICFLFGRIKRIFSK